MGETTGRTAGAERRLSWILALLTLAVRIVPAALVAGTEDVGHSWTMAARVAAGESPYVSALAAWPPLWPMLASLALRASELLAIPPHLAIKLWPIAADVAIALLLYSWKRFAEPASAAFRFALLWALNPVSIYITAIHGNFDALPSLTLLLAVLFARYEGRASSRSAWWLAAGVALKTWPLFALPALLDRRRFRASLRVAAIAIVPAVAMLLLLWIRTPAAIEEKVLGYRGEPGWWGTTALARLSGADLPLAAPLLFYGAMALTALLFLTHRDPAVAATAMLVAFLASAHGFGAQYLLWPVAVGLLAAPRATMAYSLLAAATLAAEGIGRPWTGDLGQHLMSVPSRTFLSAYGGDLDRRITALVRMPVWTFTVAWWTALTVARLRDLGRQRRVAVALRSPGVDA